MCGIAGIIRFSGLAAHERAAGQAMASLLKHRGPDAHTGYTDGIASLGHTRLSIIDLQEGHQPLANEDGTIHVVYNGEIYNHRALADDLRRRGHILRTRCDTEVIVHLYEEHGPSFVEHLNGMFAIALWDAPRRRLLLVRDRIGIKPLYWYEDEDRVVFGSELKAVHAAGVPRQLDPHALCDYLTFGHVPAPRTIARSVRKLEPGTMAVCTAGGTQLRRWWDIPFDDNASDGSHVAAFDADDWVDAFEAMLADAVRMRMIADVPLGAFLSGGVDSTAIATAMCREGSGPVMTHTVGFDEADHDERQAARQVATLLNTDHREVMVRSDAAETMLTLTGHFDEPFADASALPTYHLSEVTRRRVTVALAGDGGDEMLAGYRRYRFDMAEAAIRNRFPAGLRRFVCGSAGALYPKGDWLPRALRAKRTLENLACDDITAHLRSVALAGGALPALLLEPSVIDATGGYDPFTRGRDLFVRCPSRQLLNRLLYVDMKTLMVDDILTKVDRASMAVGLEVRVPLLDHRLVELVGRMPVNLKQSGPHNKIVLRRTLARWLGPQIAQRPKKGFDIPIDAWFRGPLRSLAHDTLMAPDSRLRQWIAPGVVRSMMNDHRKGLSANGPILWTLLALELWARHDASQSCTELNEPARECVHAAEAEVVA